MCYSSWSLLQLYVTVTIHGDLLLPDQKGESVHPSIEKLGAATKTKVNHPGCVFSVAKAFPSMGFLIPCLWRYVHRGQLRVLSTFPPVSGVWRSENSEEWGKQLERIKTHLQDAACGAFLPSLSPKCRESAVWLITPERKAEALKLKYFGNHVYRG